MRRKVAAAAVALALVVAASRLIANPVGVPPTAKPLDVVEGKTISIELGTPTAAARRSRWASFRPQARMAPFITGSTMRHRQGRRERGHGPGVSSVSASHG